MGVLTVPDHLILPSFRPESCKSTSALIQSQSITYTSHPMPTTTTLVITIARPSHPFDIPLCQQLIRASIKAQVQTVMDMPR